ncbi:Hpt domain-containing protein [Paraburkholderia rhizosphaerae]|uniref:Hpt domain-containing protein n=1 Tax=Paraburkholderia rhizosphaerae TaxID=480658 RepID=A0A4R8M013_9BURK|nr:Hpt domain-containing protein [Paraburkholderia rhizosphaerae]TDY54566.1 Hpt domain-containing protein [Paraburkholderia rhizosphaerae]
MIRRYGERRDPIHLAERRAISVGGFGADARHADSGGYGQVASGECGHRPIRMALLSSEPQEIASILTRSGISSDTHDVRFALVNGREHEALAAEWHSSFADGLPLPLASGGARKQGRCGVVLIVSERRPLKAQVDTLACGDDAIATEFMRILVDTNREALGALYDAARRAQWAELGNVTHRLNGSLSLFHCGNIIALASRMEQAARLGDAARARAILPVFASVVQSLNAVLEKMLGHTGGGPVHG